MENIRHTSILPGFALSMGVSLFFLSLIVLIPLTTIFVTTSTISFKKFWNITTDPRVLASYKLTFGTAFIAACVNTFIGVIVAWVLARYRFFGKPVIDAIIDLPFAMPTAIAGIALATIYSPNGWIGRHLEPYGIKIAFTGVGIVIALIFIGLPFVVRTVQPVIEEFDREVEECAKCLGARRMQIFLRVILPSILPSLLTGFTLAFARAIGEYGSVIFISSNIPFKTEIVSLLIFSKLEQYDYSAATSIALVMLVVSFLLLLAINFLQLWNKKIRA